MKVLPRAKVRVDAPSPVKAVPVARAQPKPGLEATVPSRLLLEAPGGTPVATPASFSLEGALFPKGLALEVKNAALGSIGFVAGAVPSRIRERLEQNDVTLLAVRHGQSEANALAAKFHEPVLAGQSNAPLTELGQKQARTAAQSLFEELGGVTWLRDAMTDPSKLPVVYVSPLDRTAQTAAALVELIRDESAKLGTPVTLPLTVDPRLIEINFGALDLQPMSAFQTSQPALYESWEAFKGLGVNFLGTFPGGESRLDVLNRQASFLDDVAAAHSGRTVICFCHLETMVGLQVATANGSTLRDGALRVMAAKLPNAAVMHLSGAKAPGLSNDA